jgi:PAS domain S-box-containing protein
MGRLMQRIRAAQEAPAASDTDVGWTFVPHQPTDILWIPEFELMTATLVVDKAGRICGWSRDAEALLGYAEAEALGQSIVLIIPPHLRERHSAGFGRYVQTGISNLPEVAISPAMHKTGSIVKVQISLRPVYDDSQKIVAVEAMMSPLPGTAG